MSYEMVGLVSPDEVLRGLADPTRRGILEHLLREGEQNVRSLTDRAGVAQATVSNHLSVLKQAGLVSARPQGRTVHYTARPEALEPLMDWIGFYTTFWRERLDRLEALLEGLDDA